MNYEEMSDFEINLNAANLVTCIEFINCFKAGNLTETNSLLLSLWS